MPETEVTETQEINPRNEAEYWAEKGVPSAAEFFAKRANLDYVATDKLLLTANLNEAQRLKELGNIQAKIRPWRQVGDRTVNMYNTPLELRSALDIVGRGDGNSEAETYVRFSLLATKGQIEALTAETHLKEQAATRMADFLQQSLKKQEITNPKLQ